MNDYNKKIHDIADIKIGDYNHHVMRINRLIRKANGDKEKEKNLAITMANRITNIDKAFGRYLVCDEVFDSPELGKIFLNRFKELTYDLKDIRKEKIMTFLEMEDED